MGTLQIKKSTIGLDYALYNGIRLNSSYDPLSEARRHLEHEISTLPGTVIIAGCTLGYLIEQTQKIFPSAKILCFFYEYNLFEYCKKKFGVRMPESCLVHKDEMSQTEAFLSGKLAEPDLEGLTVVEWGPSARLFADQSEKIRQCLAQRVREMNGSILATKTFGRRWISNAFRNFCGMEHNIVLQQGGAPAAAIIGPGPSLADSMGFLKQHRKRLFILALSSSLEFLSTFNITPDAVVATDSGFWASVLMNPLKNTGIPLFIPLSAAVPSGIISKLPIAVLNQGLFYEEALLSDVPLESNRILPGGTVAVTALHLGRYITEGPLFAAGIDLCYRDIHIHSRPHAFDILDEAVSDRINPLLSRTWKHAVDTTVEILPGGSRCSLPFKTYSGWFSRKTELSSTPLYRLHPSEVYIPGLLPIEDSEAAALLDSLSIAPFSGRQLFRPVEYGREKRIQRILDVTSGWLETLERARGKAGSDPGCLFSQPGVLDLCYTIAIDDVLHLRRLQRRGEHEKIGREIEDTLYRVRTFIREQQQLYETR